MAKKKELTAAELLALRALQECLWNGSRLQIGLLGIPMFHRSTMTYVRSIGVGGLDRLPIVLIDAGYRNVDMGREGTLRARITMTRRKDPYRGKVEGHVVYWWEISEIALRVKGTARPSTHQLFWRGFAGVMGLKPCLLTITPDE